MLVLAPVMCILGGIGASSLLLKYMKEIDSAKIVDKKSKKFENNYVLRSEVKLNDILCFSYDFLKLEIKAYL
jgi:dolichyl-diphosphooligosaccharide--protein glycosyltransferase